MSGQGELEFLAFIAKLDRDMAAALAVVPPMAGPEPLECPACGMTRARCLQFFGRDPFHEAAILQALNERQGWTYNSHDG